jgi:hypothetical protein
MMKNWKIKEEHSIHWLLRIEESYTNHQLVPSKFSKYWNILSEKEGYYNQWENNNPYIIGKWELGLVSKEWLTISKPFTKTIQKNFKRVCYYPKSKDPLPKSFQKTGYWIKTTMEDLVKYLQSL